MTIVEVPCGRARDDLADISPMTIPALVAYSRRPRWTRPALWALLGATALLYLWDLGASGYANQFYAASVQAGTQSWKALLFGFGTWAMLVPQALMGVGSVALLYGAARRASGPIAGLLAGDNRALDALLVGTDNRWAAATVGSHTTDSVAAGQIRYFLRDDSDGPGANHGNPS